MAGAEAVAGRVAVVTGAARGIGLALTRKFLEAGYRVAMLDIDGPNLVKSAMEVGRGVLPIECDVSAPDQVKAAVAKIESEFGRIDALVNNAGVTKFANHSNLDALSAEDFQRIYAVNVIGTYQMVRACAPAMKKTGRAAVVNVSSIAGKNGMGSSMAYAASKGALNTLTMSLARVLGPEIRVNAVCPGMVDSKWLREGYGARYAAIEARYRSGTPLGRPGTPEEVAAVIVWLIEGADLITGDTIMVDSGMHMGLIPPKL